MIDAMERDDVAAGASLQARLDAGERFNQAQLNRLVRQVGGILTTAHRLRRIHGRITPSDIKFDARGAVTLEGFERDTTPDPMNATCYAPLECYAPVHPQGPWTDVYSLGAVLWHAAVGEPPADALHRKGNITLTGLSPEGFDHAFLQAVDQALEPTPQRRPQTIKQWLAMFPPSTMRAVGTETGVSRQKFGRSLRIYPAVAASFAAGFAVASAMLLQPTAIQMPPNAKRMASPIEPVAISKAVDHRDTPNPQQVKIAMLAANPSPKRPIERPLESQPAVQPVKTAAHMPRSQPALIDESKPKENWERPQALLMHADHTLRKLFDDYRDLRSKLKRLYRDKGLTYAMKRQAYRESLRIHNQLLALRETRNHMARNSGSQTTNARYRAFEASIARIRTRMEEVRKLI